MSTTTQKSAVKTAVRESTDHPADAVSQKIVDRLSTVSEANPETEERPVPVSLMDKPPSEVMNRSAMKKRARMWAKELESLGFLKPDNELVSPKEVYCSTGIGDFTKVATWAQWYGIRLFSDLANIDRKRFGLVAIEQYDEGYSYQYGLLHRDTGRLRHLFNLQVNQVAPRMRSQGLKIPDWLDVTDLDHYRVG